MEGPQARKPLGKTRMVVSLPEPQFCFADLMGMMLVWRRQSCEAVTWLGCAEAGEHQRRQGNSPSHTPNWYTDSILVILSNYLLPTPPPLAPEGKAVSLATRLWGFQQLRKLGAGLNKYLQNSFDPADGHLGIKTLEVTLLVRL